MSGCATPETRIKRHPEVVHTLPAPQLQAIREGRVQPGFDMDEVRLALGRPDRVTMRPVHDRDTHEVWTYRLYQDADGTPLYRGFFHRYIAKNDPRFPFYLDHPGRRADGYVDVIFDGDSVVEIQSVGAPQPVSASATELK